MKRYGLGLTTVLSLAACSPAPGPAPAAFAKPQADGPAPTPSATAPATAPPPAAPAPTTEPAASTGPAQSLDELVQRAVAAVVANDPEAYVGLLYTDELSAAHCPKQHHKRPAAMLHELSVRVRKAVAKCHAGTIDWSQAKQTHVDEGAEKEPLEKCGGPAYDLDDVVVTLTAGDLTIELKLADPVQLGDSYVFTDNPRCRTKP